MKYRVENQLNLFEFHDCEFSLVSFDKNDLVVSVKHLNIHKDAKENPHNCDMEICLASMYFQDIQIHSFSPLTDADGKLHTEEPLLLYQGDEAKEHFANMLKSGFLVNVIYEVQRSDKRTTINIGTNSQERFLATLSYSNVAVAWDEYMKKNRYVSQRQYRYEITLLTLNGEQKEPLYITCDKEDFHHTNVTVGIKYQNQEIWGHGKDHLWEDAFADLQKHLPRGVLLKCCLTCRHGNMCPYGNKTGEVFCTKDLVIASKEDMCNLFDAESADEIENRSRRYADTCEDYKHQSSDFYTYNDYLYLLDK